MTRAQILRTKIVELLEKRGVIFNNNNSCPDMYSFSMLRDNKIIFVKDVYKHNGAAENCSIIIYVDELIDGWKYKELYTSGKITEKTGTRALNNRIDKALEKYLYSGLAPAQEGLDLFFKDIEEA